MHVDVYIKIDSDFCTYSCTYICEAPASKHWFVKVFNKGGGSCDKRCQPIARLLYSTQRPATQVCSRGATEVCNSGEGGPQHMGLSRHCQKTMCVCMYMYVYMYTDIHICISMYMYTLLCINMLYCFLHTTYVCCLSSDTCAPPCKGMRPLLDLRPSSKATQTGVRLPLQTLFYIGGCQISGPFRVISITRHLEFGGPKKPKKGP